MKKIKEEKAQSIWSSLWEQYRKEWTEAWNSYKTVIGPFIKGTASYIWLLISNILEVVKTGLLETGRILIEKLMKIIKKA